MKSRFTGILFLVLCPFFLFSQYDFGDAPEGALAYPSTGLIGAFPTCKNVPVAGWVQHTNFGAYFLNFDLEQDGNQGLCPLFAPYDNDECFADGDAGIIIPEPFTIVNGQVTVCPQSQGTSLGNTCQVVFWGSDIDINTTNMMPSATLGFFNLLIDWNQDGKWADTVMCPPANSVPEHALANFPVPNPFSGPLSILQPPPFMTGPKTGFFWARFTISEKPVPLDWNGEENFEDGESEDYLLHVGGVDFGDAPEGSLAYPDLAVLGKFPTCINTGTASFIKHYLGSSYFGNLVDNELEGNAGNCPVFNPNTNDMDECSQDGDAGLLMPMAFTITGTAGNEQVVPCQGSGGALGTVCQVLNWGTDIDIQVTGTGFVNVLFDWDCDGQWTNLQTLCGSNVVNEHVLQNFYVSGAAAVPLSTLAPPSFRAGPMHEYVWSRFTISEQPVITSPYWDGSGTYFDGETEDYLLLVVDSVTSIREVPMNGLLDLAVQPNPVTDESAITFFLARKGIISIGIIDIAGKTLFTIPDQNMETGQHKIVLKDYGFTPDNLRDGVYIIRVWMNGTPAGNTRAIVIK